MVILIVLVGYQYGYVKIKAELSSIKEEQAIKKKTLEKYIALIAEKPELEKKLVSLKETRKADDSKLITGQTPSLAAAQLQEIVKSIITSRGGTILSARLSKSEDTGNFKIITVSFDIVLPDTIALTNIIYSIETMTPSLYIRELNIYIKDRREWRGLQGTLEVSGISSGR